MKSQLAWIVSLLAAAAPLPAQTQPASPARPLVVRTPEQGLQPRAAADDAGAIHLVYLVGDPAAGELRYVRSTDAGKSFSPALTVAPKGQGAMAIGNVRGAQMALGRKARVHVAWNGPEGPGHAPAPMLYARLDDSGKGFETARNVIGGHPGLDGGGAVAADSAGAVHVVWHAPESAGAGEESRRVFVATSLDDGASFAPEIAASEPGSGVCPCCGLAAMALEHGGLAIVYRCAREKENRDTTLLLRKDASSPFESRRLDPWKVATCVMSTAALARSPRGAFAAWETEGQVRFTALERSPSRSPSAGKGARKHPSIAVQSDGEVLIAWAEGLLWARPGTLAWQRFSAAGEALDSAAEVAEVPAWSLVSAVALPGGGFVVFH